MSAQCACTKVENTIIFLPMIMERKVTASKKSYSRKIYAGNTAFSILMRIKYVGG